MSKKTTLVEEIQKITGSTGKQLMLESFAIAGVVALFDGNVKDFEYAMKRWNEVKASM